MQAIVVFFLLAFTSCMATAEVDGRAPAPGFKSGGEADLVAMQFGGSSERLRDDAVGRAAPAEASTAAPQLAPDAPSAPRHVIYSATLQLVVVSLHEAQLGIVNQATTAGGWLQASDARSVTVRVPAARFEAVVANIRSLGEVVDASVRAADVTEELLDLGIRLENARKARERLLAHLETSTKIEDTLKIEAELTRVTGEIERMEGRLRYLESQVAMSTIRVELNTNQPQRGGDGLVLPFEWIGRLGEGLIAGTVKAMPRKPGFFARGPRFDPPSDFVRYYSAAELVEALNADGLRIQVQVEDNFDEGALEFWSRLARTALVEQRSVAIARENLLADDRSLLVGTRDVGNEALGYMLVIVRSKRQVHSFEAWGPREVFDARLDDLVESAKSLRP